MGESSGEQPKVKGDTANRLLRRWEDKAVLGLGSLVLALVGLMWTDLRAQISDLEKARSQVETKVAVQDAEMAALKESLREMKGMLRQALEARKSP